MIRPPAHQPIPARLRVNAKRMRSAMTEAERRFWHLVRAGRLEGLRFRRQVPIMGYIADFICHDLKLIVEIDGGQHIRVPETVRDREREQILTAQGFRIIRFWNDDVLQNPDGVLMVLREAVGGDKVSA